MQLPHSVSGVTGAQDLWRVTNRGILHKRREGELLTGTLSAEHGALVTVPPSVIPHSLQLLSKTKPQVFDTYSPWKEASRLK